MLKIIHFYYLILKIILVHVIKNNSFIFFSLFLGFLLPFIWTLAFFSNSCKKKKIKRKLKHYEKNQDRKKKKKEKKKRRWNKEVKKNSIKIWKCISNKKMKRKFKPKSEKELKQKLKKIETKKWKKRRKKFTLSFIENLMFQAPSSHLHMVKKGGNIILTKETRVAPTWNNNNKVLAISYLRCETTMIVAQHKTIITRYWS